MAPFAFNYYLNNNVMKNQKKEQTNNLKHRHFSHWGDAACIISCLRSVQRYSQTAKLIFFITLMSFLSRIWLKALQIMIIGKCSTGIQNYLFSCGDFNHFSGWTNLFVCRTAELGVFTVNLTACSTIEEHAVIALVRWRMVPSTQSPFSSLCLQESSMMWPLMTGRPEESTGLIRNGRSAADLW